MTHCITLIHIAISASRQLLLCSPPPPPPPPPTKTSAEHIHGRGRRHCVSIQIKAMCVCLYSSSCNDFPRVAQQYRTIAPHIRRSASVLVVCIVFCVHMHSSSGLIRRMPLPTFSDTAITDCHSNTTIFQLRAH